MKHVPISTPGSKETRRRYQDAVIEKPIPRGYLEKGPKSLKKYLKRQNRQRREATRSYQAYKRPYKKKIQYRGTKTLFLMISLFSIVALFFASTPLDNYIYLSLNGLIYEYTFHTLFTALFISAKDIFGIFILFIMLYILYFMTRTIELSLGTKFLIKLYLISCLFTALFYFLLRISLVSLYPLEIYSISVGLAWGGILGLISYSLFPIMNKEITALMYFLPIRMKGRSFLLIIILFRFLGLIFVFYYGLYYILYSLPDLGGILGAYIIYKYQFKRR
ncbi:MAG: hypothetical protein ACFFB0_01005 [Promethearchaeota archaeon]